MFHQLARQASAVLGSAWMFLGSVLACGLWVLVGCVFGWSDTLHLWATSVLTWTTWAAAVIIQHEQVTQEAALNAKLDGLIRAIEAADNRLIGIEKRPPETCP